MSRASEHLKANCDEVASILKSIGHPQRLMMLCHLAEGEKTVTELLSLCEASQPLVSQFLGRMQREGLIASRREGKYTFYRIADARVSQLIGSMQKIFCPITPKSVKLGN